MEAKRLEVREALLRDRRSWDETKRQERREQSGQPLAEKLRMIDHLHHMGRK